jgi:Ca2+/Na+ antiporter
MFNNKCVIIVATLLLFLIIIFFIYKKTARNEININNKKTYEHLNNTTVVLMKTHTWNYQLEKFAIKIKNETIHNRIDFYILMHSDDSSLPDEIKDQTLKKYVLVFKESDIKKLYKQGFYSMWLCNHWILMWFYKQFKNKYQFYWSIEYDVRISGNSSTIWNYDGIEDFIYPIEPFKNPEWAWKNYYMGGPLTDNTKWYGYLQLARYSTKFLEYLDRHYQAGENGQDELITFSLFKRGRDEIGLTGSKKLLSNLIQNSWNVDNSDSDKHKIILEESETKYQTDNSQLLILHPVKY